MFLLSKVLPVFVLPLGGSLILLVWGLTRRRRGLVWLGVIVLLVSSNPFVGHYVMRTTEGWAVRRSGTAVPIVDAVVVLSPGRRLPPGTGRVSESNESNRFFGGVELFQAGKAPLLVFTGARIAGGPDLPLEGEVMAERAAGLGVPAERIAVTAVVANTADEAREVAVLLQARQVPSPRVLLVTSAFHMRRARQLFEQHGLAVEPFPVDFRAGRVAGLGPMSLLPSLVALRQTEIALRELYGRAFYWLKARIAP